MPEIPFTQYLRPDGRKKEGGFDRPQEIYDRAMKIIEKGHVFEIEVLTTGHVSITISNGKEDVAIELCKNGPEVLTTVDELVNKFYEDNKVV